jgi:hypothetical protein
MPYVTVGKENSAAEGNSWEKREPELRAADLEFFAILAK